MNKIQENTFQNATGKIDYTLMNGGSFLVVSMQHLSKSGKR